MGLQPGARVALAMRNCPEFLLVLFATWHAGLAAVPINFRLHRQEFKFIIDNAGAEVCFASSDLASTLAGLEREVESLRTVIGTDDTPFADLIAGAAQEMPCAETRPDDPAWIFYTSGTTGRPKGATLTHRNLGFMTQAYLRTSTRSARATRCCTGRAVPLEPASARCRALRTAAGR